MTLSSKPVQTPAQIQQAIEARDREEHGAIIDQVLAALFEQMASDRSLRAETIEIPSREEARAVARALESAGWRVSESSSLGTGTFRLYVTPA